MRKAIWNAIMINTISNIVALLINVYAYVVSIQSIKYTIPMALCINIVTVTNIIVIFKKGINELDNDKIKSR